MSNLIDRDEAIASLEYLERKCDIKQWNGAGYMKQILADAKHRILSLPLQQQGVFELGYCNKCIQMTNHKLECQKCKPLQQGGNEKIRELIDKKLKDLKELKEVRGHRGLYDDEWANYSLLQELLSEIDNLLQNGQRNSPHPSRTQETS